jgi:hypothetical protein
MKAKQIENVKKSVLTIGIITKFSPEHYSRKFVRGFLDLPVTFYVFHKKEKK